MKASASVRDIQVGFINGLPLDYYGQRVRYPLKKTLSAEVKGKDVF